MRDRAAASSLSAESLYWWTCSGSPGPTGGWMGQEEKELPSLYRDRETGSDTVVLRTLQIINHLTTVGVFGEHCFASQGYSKGSQ